MALLPDGAYVLPPGAIPGVGSRRAVPGDVITMYGIGFGAVIPAVNDGQVAGGSNALAQALRISFGSVNAPSIQYAGLALGSVGLYQVNVAVPTVAASDAIPMTFSVGSTVGTQNLVIAVGN